MGAPASVLFLGSITEKVLRTSPAPVLTVGAVTDTPPIGGAPFRRILCATDFSDCSIAAWHYATSLAERTDASIALLYVVAAMPVGYDPIMGPGIDLSRYEAETEKLGRERLHMLVTESALRVSNVEEIVATGAPYREILRIAAESHSDLIVLGIHGRNPIDRALFGTTAEPVVRRATCPVLTVRPAPQPASAAA
jgi:nucleotide-binding universal stress UspA family protein